MDLVEHDFERRRLVVVAVDSVIVKPGRECGARSIGQVSAVRGERGLCGATIVGVGDAFNDSLVVHRTDGVADGGWGDVEFVGEEADSTRTQGVEMLDDLELEKRDVEVGGDCLAGDAQRSTEPLDGGDELSVEFTARRHEFIAVVLIGLRGSRRDLGRSLRRGVARRGVGRARLPAPGRRADRRPWSGGVRHGRSRSDSECLGAGSGAS